MADNMETVFCPQPGDIILLQRPVMYADGTCGPLVKIYKDNFFFTTGNNMMSKPPKHIFKRGEQILRLFKLYQNWEFVTCKSHKLYLYYPGIQNYPGVDNNQPWNLIKRIHNKEPHKNSNPKFPLVTHFTHLPPSKLFSKLSKDALSPRSQDIIIHTLPIQRIKTSSEKCASCKKQEEDALYWSHDVSDPVLLAAERDFELDFDPIVEGCHYCRLPMRRDKRHSNSMPNAMPWENRWELEYWSETFEPQLGDFFVRWDIDIEYGGQFKKTHLQVELFTYIAKEKTWKYLGMDVADFGPLVQIHDIVYRPQPGDIIMSKDQNWSVRWDEHRHSGGSVLFYKDTDYFGDNEGGKNLWQFDNERNKVEIQKMPIDSWIVRLGAFDEYWDFHLNDRADVFALHPNGKTMLLHYSADFPHMSQPPLYKYRVYDHDPPLMGEVEVEPNNWDLVVRRIERVHEDPLKKRDWRPDPHHWMREPTLWGRDVPPRFDKQVELHPYWSGFVFEDKDVLLRAGFSLLDDYQAQIFEDYSYQQDESESGHGQPGDSISLVHTNASVELYQLRVDEENPPKFIFLGRDQYSFPDEYVPKPTFDYNEEVSPTLEKRKKSAKGGVVKDGESNQTTKAKKTKEVTKEGEGNENPQTKVIILKTKESDKNIEAAMKKAQEELKLEASKTLTLSGADDIALA